MMHGHRNRREMYGPNRSMSDKRKAFISFILPQVRWCQWRINTNECSMTNHFCETARAMHKGIDDDSNEPMIRDLSRIQEQLLRYLFHGEKACIKSIRIGGGKEREAKNNIALRREGTFLISRPFITEIPFWYLPFRQLQKDKLNGADYMAIIEFSSFLSIINVIIL